MFRRHQALATIGGIALTLGVAALLGLLLAYGVQPWVAARRGGERATPEIASISGMRIGPSRPGDTRSCAPT